MDLQALDKYESVFRGSLKDKFVYQEIPLKKILFITDDPPKKSETLAKKVQSFLHRVADQNLLEWKTVSGDDYDSIPQLLQICEREKPDLIVTYRHLKQKHKNLRFSIGVYLDMLTQATAFPVLILPYLEDKSGYDSVMKDTTSVTVVTTHITDEHKLVNYGLFLTEKDGKLFATHIEDTETFERYINLISKIPGIDTETARTEIRNRLLKEPAAYIQSVTDAVSKRGHSVEIVPVVKLGHAIADYKSHILSHDIDLLIMNTKDGDQMAMHGMAYSLAVELTQIPLLLL